MSDVFHRLIEMEFPGRAAGSLRVLDFGCGAGETLPRLLALGYDAYGCDLDVPPGSTAYRERLHLIQMSPYRLPYPDASFDVCVSNQVFEHVRNKREAFAEIARVLKPGGLGLHLMPPKWVLPVEPHILVPFASWMWPKVPGWWLSLWALLGIRNQFQRGMRWHDVARVNADYCRDGLHYWTHRQFREVLTEVFGDYRTFHHARLRTAQGRAARLLGRLPGSRLVAAVAGTFRESCIGHRSRQNQ